MPIDAVAILHVPLADLADRFKRIVRAADGAPEMQLFAGSGGSFGLEARDDCTLVFTFVSFHSTLEELAALIRRMLGSALDRHRDARGVLVFPDVYKPESRTYDALVTEIGEGGMWVPMVPAAFTLGPGIPGGLPTGLVAAFEQIRKALPKDLASLVRSAAEAGNVTDLEGVRRQLETAISPFFEPPTPPKRAPKKRVPKKKSASKPKKKKPAKRR